MEAAKGNRTIVKTENLKVVPDIFPTPFAEGNIKHQSNNETNIIDWCTFLITAQPDEVKAFLNIKNVPVWLPETHSLIIGKKKSRKTLFIVWLVSQYLNNGGKPEDILICDTEQSKRHAWKIREKIFKLTGQWVNILFLRGRTIEERKNIIYSAVKESAFKVVVIDGIRDLLSNINNPDQCTELISWIEYLTTSFHIHVCNILHQNKTDTNPRGHLGTELTNKADITIELELDEKACCTTVKCESSRDTHFEPFAFTHDVNELPEIVSFPSQGKSLTESEQKLRLQHVFENNLIKYNEVIEGIKMHFECGTNKAGQLLGTYLRNGWIVKNGRDKSPETAYKLMVTTLNKNVND